MKRRRTLAAALAAATALGALSGTGLTAAAEEGKKKW